MVQAFNWCPRMAVPDICEDFVGKDVTMYIMNKVHCVKVVLLFPFI